MNTVTKRVLLVEDNEADYLIVRDLLTGNEPHDGRTEQFSIDWVQTIDAAREALLPSRYDVCLVDYHLGARSGLSLIEKRMTGDPPFILLTGTNDPKVDIAAARAGAMDYLLKGHIDAPLLERSIRYAIASGQREATLQAALQQSHLLGSAVSNLNSGIVVSDARQDDNPIVFVNDAFLAMTGYAREEVLGRNCRFLQGAKTDEQTVQQMREAIAAERAFSGVILNYRKNGTTFWNGLKITPVFDDNGILLNFVGLQSDVTARLESEIALRESEENLRAAQHIAQMGSWELDLTVRDDLNKNSLRWSNEIFRIFGLQPGQIEPSSELFFQFVHADDRPLVRAAMARALETGEPYSIDHRIVLPDGRERVIHEQANLLRDEASGLPLKMVGTCQDITERKKVEEQVAASEIRYRRLFESAKDGILILDEKSGEIVDVNPFLADLLEYTADELVGRKLWEIGLFRDIAENEDAFRELREVGYVRYENLPLETKSGARVAVEFVSNVYDVGGGKVIQCNIRDITERKRAEDALQASEEQFSNAFEYAAIGMALVDTSGHWLQVNQALCDLLGYSEAELMGRTFQEITHPDDLESDLENLNTLLAGEIRFFTMEKRYFHRDGHVLWVVLGVSLIRDAEGQPLHFISQIQDITERKAATEELRRASELLKAVTEGTPDAVFAKDRQGRYLMINSAGARFLGKTVEEVLGKTDSELFASRGTQNFSDSDRLVLDTGEARNIEESFALDGVMRTFLTSKSPLRTPQGDIAGVVGISRDISERKRADIALRESEERFQSIVANVPGMVYQFVLQPDGAIEWPFVSEGCREIYEVAPESIKNNPSWALDKIHPDDRPGFDSSVAASAETLSPWRWEGRYRLPSGRTKWVECASRPQRLPGGGTLWDGLVLDITGRKEAEAERDQFFTMSQDMLAIAGMDGYFKRVNPAFTEILGFSEAELLARPFLDFVHPDNRAETEMIADSNAQGHSIASFENRYRTKNGDWRWLEWKSVTLEDEGLIYAAARDVTERKQAEFALLQMRDELEARVQRRTGELEEANAEARTRERQQQAVAELGRRALADADPASLLEGAVFLSAAVLDVGLGVLVEWLPESQEFLVHAAIGWPPHLIHSRMPVLPGSLWNHLLHASAPVVMDDSETETRFTISPLMREQKIRSLVAVTIQVGEQVSDGQSYGALALGSPVAGAFDEDDVAFLQSVSNMVAIAIEQRRIQEVAGRARQEAEAANHAKSEFLSRMSHELRTPLNAILGFGQILDRQELSALQHESVGYILKGGRHLLALINEVLDIARVEAGHMELSIEPVVLADLIAESCALVQPLAQEGNIRLENSATAEGDHHVMADLQRLKQVLINLLANAIKYNRENGEVEVSVKEVDDERIQLRVRDSGFGLTPQDIEKLFTPFERLNAADSQIEGTGLGLVLTKRLVTAMVGTMGVESEVGKGSTFWVELPQAKALPVEALNEMEVHPPPVRETSRTYNVLSIEDNLSNIRLLEAIFEGRPEIKLLTAMQGSIGLALARQHHPDVVLLDLNLPGISGGEVLKQLRASEATRSIPVIVISADATPTQIERLLAGGAQAYLTKPLDVDAFLETLDKVLQIDQPQTSP